MKLAATTLDDKYVQTSGTMFMTGTQALVKLALLQRTLDAARGLNTAGFVSGYRGSPLGNFDIALWGARELLDRNQIRFQPAVNEELAATACWGTQQAMLMPDAKYDGVFAAWYGKGPGVDRSGDALKHGNLAGTARHGGVLVLAGDDHMSKSSTLAHQSEQALIAALIPVLNPPSVREYLHLGLAGWALSRFAGVWVGLKCLGDTVESSGTIAFDLEHARFDMPSLGEDFARLRAPLATLQTRLEEEAVIVHRLEAARAFARHNRLDRPLWRPATRRLALVTAGKPHVATLQALSDLGIDRRAGEALGLGIYNVTMPWPLDVDSLRDFVVGYDEVLFIEDKRAIVEPQAAHALYNLAPEMRPRVTGKRGLDEAPLLPSHGELSPAVIRRAVLTRLAATGPLDPGLIARADHLDSHEARVLGAVRTVAPRTPAFCSGCPHNRSTRVPEGSIAMGGIGCHTIAIAMPDRPTLRPTQMGGEAANWIGMSPFVRRPHVFQNLGDGTYFHSGVLAVRAAVAAGVNVTFKLLYNDAVAMTGGQPLDGKLTVPQLAQQLKSEGVGRTCIVTDEPAKYRDVSGVPSDVEVRHRADLIALEKELRELRGVTAIIYDQACAAEKRRRRKRGIYPDPHKRYFINSAVCEGCGDCGRVSNCVSLLPQQTAFGIKRRIDQGSCNKDYSCVDGFCPSFVTVVGGRLRRGVERDDGGRCETLAASLPKPASPLLERPYDILVAGIGGTGVVTVGALLGMAAHLEGKACTVLDQTGLSQKNGAVFSHVRLAPEQGDLTTARIGIGGTDALIGCDLVVAGSADAASICDATRTKGVVNTHAVPLARLQQDARWELPAESYLEVLSTSTAIDADDRFDATDLAEKLFGNALLANVILLGAAYQKGLVPLDESTLLRAIELNGVAIPQNRRAFLWGRIAVADQRAAADATGGGTSVRKLPETFEEILAHRQAHLTEYQNGAYARSFLAFIERVAEREQAVAPGRRDLARAAAIGLSKLMTYKDEYEVARLFVEPRFRSELQAQFEGAYRIRFNFAPPFLARRAASTGEILKIELGGWMWIMLRGLATLRFLRGSWLDPFGWSAERRMERELVEEYQAAIEQACALLSAANYDCALEIAKLPEIVRGYGHVKRASVEEYRASLAKLIARLHAGELAAAA